MLTETVPVYVFAKMQLESRDVKAVTDEWRVETEMLLEIALGHYKNMGIYEVTPESEVFFCENFLNILRDSPEVTRLILESKKREKQLARNRRNSGD